MIDLWTLLPLLEIIWTTSLWFFIGNNKNGINRPQHREVGEGGEDKNKLDVRVLLFSSKIVYNFVWIIELRNGELTFLLQI